SGSIIASASLVEEASKLAVPGTDVASPAFQVIVLGSGGGPSEGNVSGYLIRSTATAWAKGSLLAVDAGTHLAGMIRILEEHQLLSSSLSDGLITVARPPPLDAVGSIDRPFPFAGANLPHKTPRANAAYIIRELVSAYLITHPHLDHISGFVINTPAFDHIRNPKRLAALPSTIQAIKTHIFNDVIWPNLSDEDAGVGFVTYMRLPECAEEYVEVCHGLSVQAWPVSHGHCMRTHSHRGRGSTPGPSSISGEFERSPGGTLRKICVYDSAVFFIKDDSTGREVMMWGDVEPDSISLSPRNHPAWNQAAIKFHAGVLNTIFIECSYDSCQPDDALYGHLSPPHLLDELGEMAKRVVALRECEDQRTIKLKRKRMSNGYNLEDPETAARRKENPNWPGGHLEESREPIGNIKYGNGNGNGNGNGAVKRVITGSKTSCGRDKAKESEKLGREIDWPATSNSTATPSSGKEIDNEMDIVELAVGQKTPEERPLFKSPFSSMEVDLGPLAGLHLVVTHVKDVLMDDIEVGEDILKSLKKIASERRLGCTFSMSEQGRSIYF
ncbi:3',5'-cyclic-nucleotide phosphodiesterase pde1, partial [Rhizina undulata]